MAKKKPGAKERKGRAGEPDPVQETAALTPPELYVPRGAGRRILIVDDSESVRGMVRRALEAMDVIDVIEEAADGVEGLSALSRSPFDLVITDVTMPRLDGFKLVSAVRQNPKTKDVMIVMLSGRGESVDKVKGLTMGANDYVTKPFEEGELQARVAVMCKMKELQEELQVKNRAMEEANQKLALLANQDGLTSIPNRRFFFERCNVEFARARRLKSPLGLLMMDIDHFKNFNDTFGHLSGDEALRKVAGTVQKCLRAYDMVGRYGGEEIIAFLPETDCKNALLVAERLRRAVAAQSITPVGREGAPPVNVTVSIGVACIPDNEAANVEQLVEHADSALYMAKTEGRNRVVVAPPSGKAEKAKS